MAERSYQRPGRKRRRSALGRLMTFGSIGLVLFLGVSVFFRVNEIRVLGETRYMASEVAGASGVEYGEHMLFLNPDAIRADIAAGLPYVGQVELRRRFPSRLEITVYDTFPMAVLPTAEGYWLMDRDAKLLELAETEPDRRLIRFEGVGELHYPWAGAILDLGEEARDKLLYIQDILHTLDSLEIAHEVSRIDMSNVQDPLMEYAGRFRVRMGAHRRPEAFPDLHGKMRMLIGIIATMDDHETGVIDLNPQRPVFRPDDL